jgi:hypothetical protein
MLEITDFTATNPRDLRKIAHLYNGFVTCNSFIDHHFRHRGPVNQAISERRPVALAGGPGTLQLFDGYSLDKRGISPTLYVRPTA